MYTLSSLALLLALTSLNVQAAGPHQHGRKLATHRRHHARAIAAAAERGETAPSSKSSFALPLTRDEDDTTSSDSCTLGAWKCSGTELHRCYNDRWNFVTNCTGADIVCSDALYTTGCVWTWDVESAASASATASSETLKTSALASATVTSTTDPAVTGTATTSATTATTTDDGSEECDDDDNDEDEDDEDTCDDDDDKDEDEDEDDEETCDDDEVTSTASASVITAGTTPESASTVPVLTTASTTTEAVSAVTELETASTTVATATSAIGGGLFADSGDDGSSSTSATRSGKTRSYGRHKTTSTSAGGSEATQTSTGYDYGSSGTASITATSTDGDFTASATATSDDSYNVTSSTAGDFTASATATATSDESYNVTTSLSAGYTDVTQTSTSGRHQSITSINSAPAGVANATIAASGRPGVTATTVTTSAKTYAPTVTSSSNTTTSNTWSAPHWVIYADEWLDSMPSVSDLSSFNRFILAFWMTDSGAVDDAEAWAGFDASTRASVLEEYHNAGIALMVSAFGSTDAPTSNGADAKQTAQDLAAWVKKYDLDGVDIDYEDMDAMNSAEAVSWIVEFQAELRRLLPSPYIISHAPVAPWFTSASDYSDGAYVAIDQQVGDGIDWYNVQFYNQGSDQYTSCETLITNSGTDWPSTSVLELNSYAGVDLDKIVIGKPLDSGAADNGYMDAATIHQCVEIAKESGWNAGVMFWEWTDQAPSIMSSVRGGD